MMLRQHHYPFSYEDIRVLNYYFFYICTETLNKAHTITTLHSLSTDLKVMPCNCTYCRNNNPKLKGFQVTLTHDQ